MTPSTRSVLGAILLPGLLIGTVYVYAVGAGAERTIVATRESIRSARREAPTPAAETEQALVLSRLQDELERLRGERDQVARQLGDGDSPLARSAAAERLAQLLARCHLRLTEETCDSGLSAFPAELARLTPLAAGAPGRVRTLRFSGRYLDVLAACGELADPGIRAVPLRLRMARSPDGGLAWTLVVWL